MKNGEAGVLQFTGLQRVGHDLRLNDNNKGRSQAFLAARR